VRTTPRDARRRALAQNFLVDRRAIAAVVGSVRLDPERDTVLDLGAGRGALTGPLAARAARVVAVERDADWAVELRARAGAWPNVRVIHGDALTVPFPAEPFTVVASPPWNIGTALLRRLLAEGHGLAEAALVLQLEAARRLAGGGRFAATWAPWVELAVAAAVPRQAFRPVPRAGAAILHVRPRRPALLAPAAFTAHVELVDAVFAAPGRTAGERLARVVGRRRAARLAAAAGVPPGTTPADVSPVTWARLTRALLTARRPARPVSSRAL
jgi:23S rRNA (adenine-N6)-dimethyltransferase